MADSKVFHITEGITAEGVGREVEAFLQAEKSLVTQGIASPDGYLVQAKEESSWKNFAGLGKALQVQIIPSGDSELIVNIGQGKWADKAGAAVLGSILFAPLAITAAVGAYNQSKLPEEIFACIEKFIMMGGHSVRRNVSFTKVDAGQMKCPSCGAVNDIGKKFCSSCGGKLSNACPSCGASVPPGKKFCPECGSPMNKVKANACPSCGTSVPEGQKFCPECGTSMANLNKVLCPSCGNMVEKEQKFCPECGAPMGAKTCVNCGAELADGQKFCGKCGNKVE